MAHTKFKKPVRARVGVGDRSVPGVVRGEWNGFAVASVKASDVQEALGGPGEVSVERVGDELRVTLLGSGDECRFKVRRGRVDLGDGWALQWEPA
jgi:hypothetical protein